MSKQRKRTPGRPGGAERSEAEPGLPGGATPGRPLGRGSGTLKRYTPEERRWALEAWERSGLPAAVFARQWGVSEPTLNAWRRAFRERGAQGLEGPRSTGKRRGRPPLRAEVAAEVVATTRRFPDFGLRRVRDYLARFVGLKVSTGGVRAVLVREGVERTAPVPRRGRRRRRPKVRHFERARPGQLWQSDFTSFLLSGTRSPVYLIVFLDDCSRYVVAWSLRMSQTAAVVRETFLEGVARYGKPAEVLTDQGPQYYTWRGKSAFRKLLEREGVKHVVARSHHPQTVGKCERLWESIGRELWDRTHPRDLAEAQDRLRHYFAHYNHFRPHQGIGGIVPADRFFGAESEVRAAIESSITKNELRLALGERPRRSVYLAGQVDGHAVSLAGERGRLVLRTSEGSERVVALDELGAGSGGAPEDSAAQSERAKRSRIDATDVTRPGTPPAPSLESMDANAEGGNDDDPDDDCGAPVGAADPDGGPGDVAAAAAQEDGGRLPAAGAADQGDLGLGERGGAEEGAGSRVGAPRVLAGTRDEGGALAPSGDPADPRVADVAAGDLGDGDGAPASAGGTARGLAASPAGGEGAAPQGGRARGGDLEPAAADRAPPDAPGPDAAGDPAGGEPCEGVPPSPRDAAASSPCCERSCGGTSANTPAAGVTCDGGQESPA